VVLLLLASLGSLAHFAGAAVGILAYFLAMLVHEGGHVLLARRRGYQAYSVDLYPLVGVTRLESPRTRLDQAVIAWGGVLFQGLLALPMLIWILAVGYTPIEVVNAFMALFAYLAVLMVPVNLIPIAPLDGASAWGAVPILWRSRPKLRRMKRRTHLRIVK
jgi:Zn-dependent protease